jgi:hypothetical protein
MTDVTTRMNYYDGEFLKAVDFTVEQSYHIDRQQRHNRQLHTPGVADGLNVAADSSGVVTVAAGTALDNQGRQIVLPATATVDLSKVLNTTALVTICYSEQLIDNADPNDHGTATAMRCEEVAVVQALPMTADVDTTYPPGTYVRLAQITVDSSGKGTVDQNPSPNPVQYAGAKNSVHGWLQLPFVPKPYSGQSGANFTLALGSAAADPKGSDGIMEIPIPPGATKLTTFGVGGASLKGTITIELHSFSWSASGNTGVFEPNIYNIGTVPVLGDPPITAGSSFYKQFSQDIPIGSNPLYFLLRITTTADATINMVAVEFGS